MNIILLPGKSEKNKPWIKQIASIFETQGSSTFILHYSHWGVENKDLDFELELDKLKDIAEKKEKVIIFAKSVGTILAIKAIFDKAIQPVACIFVGTAIGWAKITQKDFDSWFKDYSVPTLFIQKALDPAMPAQELKDLLIDSNVKNYKLLEIPGDNHDYEDIDLLVNSSLEFVNKLKLQG